MRRRIEINGTALDYELLKTEHGRRLITETGGTEVFPHTAGETDLRLTFKGGRRKFSHVRIGGELWLTDGRAYYRAKQLSTSQDRSAAVPQGRIVSHMPGKILAVNVEPGQRVKEGEALVVLEAMKMEHTLSAPAAGMVRAVPVSAEQRVMPGDLLVELELSEA